MGITCADLVKNTLKSRSSTPSFSPKRSWDFCAMSDGFYDGTCLFSPVSPFTSPKKMLKIRLIFV